MTVVTKSDNGSRIDHAHLVDVTPILFWLWTMGQWLDRVTIRGAIYAARVAYTIEVAYCGLVRWFAEPLPIPSLWGV